MMAWICGCCPSQKTQDNQNTIAIIESPEFDGESSGPLSDPRAPTRLLRGVDEVDEADEADEEEVTEEESEREER